MSILINREHELRTGWRALAFVAVFFLLLIATSASLSIFVPADLPQRSLVGALAYNAVALLLPSFGATLFMARIVDGMPLAALGITPHAGWGRDFALGAGAAAAMLAALPLGALIFGTIDSHWTATASMAGLLLLIVAILMVSAANEELLFRGYLLQVLMKGVGAWPAAILMSCLFGLLHISNPHAAPLGILNTMLAGLLLSLAYLRTRSLWLPYGIHAGWNIGLGVVLGFPLSGLEIPALWKTEIAGAEMILGGDYGPEDGLLGTFVFIAATAAVWWMRSLRVSPEVRAAIDAHPGKLRTVDSAAERRRSK